MDNLDKILKPKSEEDILKSLKRLSPNNILIKSSRGGFLEGVKISVKKGVNINIAGGFAIRHSCARGHYDIVKYLIDNGANIHIMSNMPLLRALTENNINIVKLLLDNGAKRFLTSIV
jgi:hypothetical protein